VFIGDFRPDHRRPVAAPPPGSLTVTTKAIDGCAPSASGEANWHSHPGLAGARYQRRTEDDGRADLGPGGQRHHLEHSDRRTE
jgi:hypothetical protein